MTSKRLEEPWLSSFDRGLQLLKNSKEGLLRCSTAMSSTIPPFVMFFPSKTFLKAFDNCLYLLEKLDDVSSFDH